MHPSLFGTPNGNRTHNCPLGGGCYIHLTMEAYKIFPDAIAGEINGKAVGGPSRARTLDQPVMSR